MQLWILSLIPAIAMVSHDHIYHEIDGDLWKQQLNFSLVATKFTGIILYAVGDNYQYSIRFADSKGIDKQLILHYKYHPVFHYTSYHNISCDCINCFSMHLTFRFFVGYTFDSFICNNVLNRVKWIFHQNISNTFVGFRKPPNLINPARSCIWIGNAEQNSSFYLLDKNQFVGCIDSLYINGKALNISTNGKYFYSCNTTIPETICQKQNCSSKSWSVKLFKCDWPVLNDEFCKNELSEYTITSQRFDFIGHLYRPITFGLKWKQKKTSFQCLMEIQLKDGSVLLLTINTQSYLILLKRQIHSSVFEPIMLNKVSNNVTNVLFIEISDRIISMSTYDQKEIHQYIDPITDVLHLINIGFTNVLDICGQFEGFVELEYNSTQFKAKNMNSSSADKKSFKTLFKENQLAIVFFSLTIFLVTIIITGSLIHVCKIKKAPKIYPGETIDRRTIQKAPLESLVNYPYGVVSESSGYTYF